MKPSTPEAYKLLLDGSAALTNVEHNGMRIDVKYLDRTIEQTAIKIKQMESKLKEDEVYKTWRKTYGEKSDLGSRKQLGNVIFNILGVECKNKTKAGNPKTGAEVLQEVDFPFVKKWNNFESLKKIRSTFLIGVRKETVNGILHPFFHLHLAITYRPSSSGPNFQNIPIRDPRQAKLIRRAFVPRNKDYLLVEFDYSGMEWRIASCLSQDDGMVKDSDDPHSIWASKCYLNDGKAPSDVRHAGKNQFVFPQLYGSFYKQCAKNLWNTISIFEDSSLVKNTLEKNGISELGKCDFSLDPIPDTFEYHIKNVEDKFWKRYPDHNKWRRKWANDYKSVGQFKLLTGFTCQGIYTRNQLFNYPIQGPAFHCLLWSLIKINNWLVKNKMKTMVIGNIHDSIELDAHRDELDEVLEVCDRIMTEEIKKEWPWIIVPLAVECKIGEKNWFEMKEIAI